MIGITIGAENDRGQRLEGLWAGGIWDDREIQSAESSATVTLEKLVNPAGEFVFQQDIDGPGNPHPGIPALNVVAEQKPFRIVPGMTQGAITVLFNEQFGEPPAFQFANHVFSVHHNFQLDKI